MLSIQERVAMFGKNKKKNLTDFETFDLDEIEEMTDEDEVLEMSDTSDEVEEYDEFEDFDEFDEFEEDDELEDTAESEDVEGLEDFDETELTVVDSTEVVIVGDAELATLEDTELATLDEDIELEVVYLDDEEDVVAPKKKRKGLWWKILLGVLGLLIIVYLGIAACFTQVFFYYTSINGEDVSLQTVEEVQAHFSEQVDSYELTLTEIDGVQEVITADSVNLTYQESEEVAEILATQNPLKWYEIFYEIFEYEVNVGVEYDEDALTEVLAELNCTQEELMIEPVSAYPEYVEGEYTIVTEDLGSELRSNKFAMEVDSYLLGLMEELNLYEEGCYTEPQYTTESEEVIAATETLNTYVKATVTYDEGEEIDSNTIATWLVVSDKLEVSLDGDAITDYVSDLADAHNTVGTTRSITTPGGKTTTVSGGSYGFKVDESAEIKQIKADITSGEAVSRDIEYSSRGASYSEADWGDTYAEIDLSAQKMWYVKDGEVIVECSVVTGCVSDGHATPQGVYSLAYKVADKVLRGTQYADGSYEYESPVSWWMPFNGGIGMHDATWRSSFGGTIYKTNGSHGCINMPLSAAATVYKNITAGTPVICHY